MKNISITIINENNTLTFDELCHALNSDRDLIIQLIEYHIIQPKGTSKENWEFDHVCLKRGRLARNFYYDLEVNLQGVGLLIDLLEKIDALETHLAINRRKI